MNRVRIPKFLLALLIFGLFMKSTRSEIIFCRRDRRHLDLRRRGPLRLWTCPRWASNRPMGGTRWTCSPALAGSDHGHCCPGLRRQRLPHGFLVVTGRLVKAGLVSQPWIGLRLEDGWTVLHGLQRPGRCDRLSAGGCRRRAPPGHESLPRAFGRETGRRPPGRYPDVRLPLFREMTPGLVRPGAPSRP